MSGTLIGVGTGPGDPELLTLKALRVLERADVVAHFAKRGRNGNARRTIEGLLKPDVLELPLFYPVTTEIDKDHADYITTITGFYEESARRIESHLSAGRDVAVLSEGDPLFYGSYMHLHVRLGTRYATHVIPGISAMSGCWSQTGLPIVQGDDILSILPGTLPEGELARRLLDTEGFVIMKVGRNLAKIRRALAAAGKLDGALYVERGTMDGTFSLPLGDKPDDDAPYFSLILGAGWQRRACEAVA